MTKEEFRAMEKIPGMIIYVPANVGTLAAAGKLVKVFKDSVILDFTPPGVYNDVDHRLFRCEEISAEPVKKERKQGAALPHYRCEETGDIFATLKEAAAWCHGSAGAISWAIREGRTYRGHRFVKLEGQA